MKISSIRRSNSPTRAWGRPASSAPARTNSITAWRDAVFAAIVKDRVAPGTLSLLASYKRRVDRIVNREAPQEAGDLEDLFDQTIQATDPERPAFVAQRLAYRDETPEPHAADVGQLA